LPLIKEADEKDKEAREIKDKKKVIGKKIHALIEQRNKVNQQIDEMKEKQKTEKGDDSKVQEQKKGKEDRPKHPITIKIDGIKSDIKNLRNTKQTIKDDHDAAYKAWREQLDLEKKIKWIKKQKAKLQRQKEEQDRIAKEQAEEDRIRKEKEEYEKLFGKPKKYQPQIDICENLISFLGTLSKTKNENENEEESHTGYNAKDVEDKLAQGDWKKEKVHILKSKKDDENQGVQPGGGKKNKKKGKKNKEHAKEVDTKLTLTIETLGYFDQIKVSPPTYGKEIVDVIEKLKEKRDYFVKVSDDLNEGKQPDEEEAKNNTNELNTEEKKEVAEKPKGIKEKVTLEDEDMFPAMGGN